MNRGHDCAPGLTYGLCFWHIANVPMADDVDDGLIALLAEAYQFVAR